MKTRWLRETETLKKWIHQAVQPDIGGISAKIKKKNVKKKQSLFCA